MVAYALKRHEGLLTVHFANKTCLHVIKSYDARYTNLQTSWCGLNKHDY